MTASFDDGKDDGALRTIGEVSKALGIKTHVLRYWEQQFPQLEPLKRSGGRRYYRSEDVSLIESIDRLVNQEGYTIKGAQKALVSGEVQPDPAPETAPPAVPTVSNVPPVPLSSEMPTDGGVDAFFGQGGVAASGVSPTFDESPAIDGGEEPPAQGDAAQPAEASDQPSDTHEELVKAVNAEVVTRLKSMRGALADALKA